MIQTLHHSIVLCFLSLTTFMSAQSSTDSSYTGELRSPIDVANPTAKINLDAQVLQLLQFNASVDLSVDRVSLSILNVTAKVLLEARLEDLVRMINDTLKSPDLNPVLATLGQAAGEIVCGIVEGIAGGTPPSSPAAPRFHELENNILYSINDSSGDTHTNRIVSSRRMATPSMKFLNKDANAYNQQVVGSYLTDMTDLGRENQNVVRNGQSLRELELEDLYTPMADISTVSAIYVNAESEAVATQVLF